MRWHPTVLLSVFCSLYVLVKCLLVPLRGHRFHHIGHSKDPCLEHDSLSLHAARMS